MSQTLSRGRSITQTLKCGLLASTTAAIGFGVPSQANATQGQAGAQPAPDAAAAPVDAGEIVVTARRRTERLIDVPAVVNVLGSETLDRYATNNLESITSQVPQVMITKSSSGNGASVTIRGLGSNTAGDDGVEQAVSFSFDGVSTSRGRLISQALFDVENVQVLKGPQALYFGKNSPAGVIVIETKGPTDEFEGYAKAGYEFKAQEYRLEGAVGGPITDTLGVRLAVIRNEMYAGYVKNVAGPIAAATSPVALDRARGYDQPGRPYKWGPGSKQTAARLTVAFQPTDHFSAKFKFLASKYSDLGDQSQFVNTSCPPGSATTQQRDLGAIAFTGAPGIVADPYSFCGRRRVQSVGALNPELASRIPGSNGGIYYLKTTSYLSSLVLDYRLNDITLTSVTGYYHGKVRGFHNFDSTAFALITSKNGSTTTTWTQELRAVSDFDGPINFSMGAFYADDKKNYPYATALVRSIDPVTDFEAYAAAGDSETHGKTYSVFGELTWKIVPSVELSGGARYTREKKVGELSNTYVQPGLVTNLGLALPAGVVLRPRYNESNVSPQVTLSWHPTENSTVFAGYRTGFKSGGIANPGLIPRTATATNVVFGNEKIKGYEAGVKFLSSDRRLDGEITVYHYLYSGLQLSAFDNTSNTLFIKNAAAVTTDGVEGSFNFRASREFTLRGAVGYNRARYSDFTNSACWAGQTAALGCINSQQDLTGQRIVRAPDWNFSGGVNWDHEINSDFAIGATLDATHSSGFYTVTNNNPYAYQKAYTLIDASIRIRSTNSSWELALIGKNLTNKFYATLGGEVSLAVNPGSIRSIAGPPRTALLQATHRF